MTRVFNFSAGPAALPQSVLEQAAAEMLDWHGAGMGVMEMSHRGTEFMAIHQQALDDLRALLAVPANYRILFLQGGAIAENALIPLNLIGRSKTLTADYLVTGSWSAKSFKEAQKYGAPRAVTASAAGGYTTLPAFADWQLSDDAAYLHLCSNETIDGVQFHAFPDWGDRVVVADMSSDILSRPLDVGQFGVIYAGAQKNIGPAGLTIAIVREDLLGAALPATPSAFDWKIVADHNSMYNTPPTYAIYIAGLVFQWLKAQGGVAAIDTENRAKAQALYDCIDASSLYQNHVDRGCRSLMNVPFHLRDAALNDAFLAQARAAGLVQLKGHKSVGGMRASLYNAMSRAGVEALVAFMREFERKA